MHKYDLESKTIYMYIFSYIFLTCCPVVNSNFERFLTFYLRCAAVSSWWYGCLKGTAALLWSHSPCKTTGSLWICAAAPWAADGGSGRKTRNRTVKEEMRQESVTDVASSWRCPRNSWSLRHFKHINTLGVTRRHPHRSHMFWYVLIRNAWFVSILHGTLAMVGHLEVWRQALRQGHLRKGGCELGRTRAWNGLIMSDI